MYSEKSLDFKKDTIRLLSEAFQSQTGPKYQGQGIVYTFFLMQPHLSVMHFEYPVAQLADSNASPLGSPGCST